MKEKGISFAICVHNEGDYIKNLMVSMINFVMNSPEPKDFEIVILDDNSTDQETLKALEMSEKFPFVKIHKRKMNGDYAAQKNYLNSLCSKEWIFNLDADEKLPPSLLQVLPYIPGENPDIEAYWVPRVNVVEGLTLEDVRNWKWVITPSKYTSGKVMKKDSGEHKLLKEYNLITQEIDMGNDEVSVTYYDALVCWPDFQMRFYKNEARIVWENKVHEKLVGYNTFSNFPVETDYAIIHLKDIDRQRQQNNYYDKIQRGL